MKIRNMTLREVHEELKKYSSPRPLETRYRELIERKEFCKAAREEKRRELYDLGKAIDKGCNVLPVHRMARIGCVEMGEYEQD